MRMTQALLLLLLLVGCSSFQREVTHHPSNWELSQSWVRSVPLSENNRFRTINRSRPLLVGDRVIQASSHDGLAAFNLQSGARLWTLKIPFGVEASPAVINDRLFYPSRDGNVYSIDASTGKILWSFETKFENLGEPLLVDGTLYFLSATNVLFSIDAADGKQNWVYARQDSSNFSVRGGSRPVYYNGVVYAGFSDGSVVALNAQNGALQWESQLNKNKKFRDLDANLIINQDQLLVAGYDDHLYSLDPKTGLLKWRADGGSFSGPTVDNDVMYYPTSQGEVLSLDLKTGQVRWRHKVAEGIPTEVSLNQEFIFFGESAGALKVLDKKTGQLVTSFTPGMGIMSPPLVSNRGVLFISGEGNLYSLSLRKIKPSFWSF